MKRLFLFLFLAIVTLHGVYAQEIPPAAWITNGSLWVNGEQIAEVNACCALFSPERTRLAYLEVTETHQNLIILDTSNPQQPLQAFSSEDFASDSRLSSLAWQNENLLWLNTFEWQPSEGIYAPLPRWDLWQVDISTGSRIQVKPAGEGGIAVPSPDGTKYAVINPGNYGTQFATITLYDLDGNELTSYEYPAVSSASEVPWLPTLDWIGDTVRFAIPDADLVYNYDPATLPPTALIELSPEKATVLGEIKVDFPVNLVWSSDGNQVAYTRKASPEQADTTVYIWDIAAKMETEIFNAPTFISLLSWENALTLYLPETGDLIFWHDENNTTTYENVRDFVSLGNGTGLLVQGDFEKTQIFYLENDTLTPIAESSGMAFLAR